MHGTYNIKIKKTNVPFNFIVLQQNINISF